MNGFWKKKKNFNENLGRERTIWIEKGFELEIDGDQQTETDFIGR